jgi:hypothetical protein
MTRPLQQSGIGGKRLKNSLPKQKSSVKRSMHEKIYKHKRIVIQCLIIANFYFLICLIKIIGQTPLKNWSPNPIFFINKNISYYILHYKIITRISLLITIGETIGTSDDGKSAENVLSTTLVFNFEILKRVGVSPIEIVTWTYPRVIWNHLFTLSKTFSILFFITNYI